MTELELDLLCAQLNDENRELKIKVELLETQCRMLREQVYSLEKQVYSGPTM
jgi:chaperonin cofactor prefoldin